MEYIGYWNLPGKEEIPGILKLEDTITLELLGVLNEKQVVYSETLNDNIDIIQGFTQEGLKITLYKCMNIETTVSAPGIAREKYRIYTVFIGEKYSGIEDLNIKEVSATYDYLNDWIETSESIISREIEGEKKIEFSTKLPDEHRYDFSDMSINVGFKMNIRNNPLITEFTYGQSPIMKFKFDSLKNYEGAFEEVFKFKDFMSICIGKPVRVIEIKMLDENDKIIKVVDKNNINLKSKDDNFRVNQPLLMYKDIKDNFVNVYTTWINLQEKLKPIINKIKMCEKEEGYFNPQIHFMNIITATETFSRRLMNNYEDKEDLHLKRLDEIMLSISNPEYKEWLKNKLKYSNEPTLYKRLLDIFGQTEFVLNISKTKRKKIAFKITETRNYYTHFGEDEKKKLTLLQSVRVYDYLKLCLKLLICKEIHINMEDIIKEKKNCRDLRCIYYFKSCFNID